jgi:hypothetical protein
MTIKHHAYGKSHDSRFSLHQRAPRADKLGRDVARICRVDHSFAEALRRRVSNPARWEAFMAGDAGYVGNRCPRCQSTLRRTRDRSCLQCKRDSTAGNYQRMLAGIRHMATRSRDGYLALLEAKRKEKAGDAYHIVVGAWTAQSFATGRLAVQCPVAHINQPDLASLSQQQIFSLVHRYPDLLEVMRAAGWSV